MSLNIDMASPELLGDIAKDVTEKVLQECSYVDRKNITKYDLTISQIRKFYSEFQNIELKLPATEKIPDDIYGQIKLIKAKAIYNSSRKSSALPKPFVDFISICIDSVKSTDSKNKVMFIKTCRLFEAFVGYSGEFKLEQ